MDDDLDFGWMQRELAKRLGLKKYKKYPAEPLRILLNYSERREDFEMANRREEEWEAVLPYARVVLQVWETAGPRESFPQDRQIGERAAEQLGDYELERSRVFSDCLAKLASTGPIVEGFRAKYLGGQVLSSQKARELLRSPVAARWSRFAFALRDLPIVGHNHQVQEDRRPIKAGPWYMFDRAADARSNARPKRELKKTKQGDWKILPFPGEDGQTHRVFVRPRSVLGDLHDKVSRLIRSYPWEEPDAVWFVLTGETPWVAPFTWQFRGFGDGVREDSFGYGFITLKIEPWVPAGVVQRVYGDIQRELRGGRRNRRGQEKGLKLLRFVNERANVAELSRGERRRLAPELVAAWDKENPDDPYEHDTWKYWRDYHRARQAVMSPTYEWRDED